MNTLTFQKSNLDGEYKNSFTEEISDEDLIILRNFIKSNKETKGFFRYIIQEGSKSTLYHTTIFQILNYIKDTQKQN